MTPHMGGMGKLGKIPGGWGTETTESMVSLSTASTFATGILPEGSAWRSKKRCVPQGETEGDGAMDGSRAAKTWGTCTTGTGGEEGDMSQLMDALQEQLGELDSSMEDADGEVAIIVGGGEPECRSPTGLWEEQAWNPGEASKSRSPGRDMLAEALAGDGDEFQGAGVVEEDGTDLLEAEESQTLADGAGWDVKPQPRSP